MPNPLSMEDPAALDELPPLDSETPVEVNRPKPAPVKPGKAGRRAVRSSTSSSESKEGKLKQIGSDLDQAFVLIGTALTPFAPVTGTTLVMRGPQGSDIVCNIARRDERVYRALLAVSKYAIYGELAMFVGALGIAVTIDLGQTDPNSFIAQRMVGRDIMEQVYAARGSANGAAAATPPIAAVPSGWNPQGS